MFASYTNKYKCTKISRANIFQILSQIRSINSYTLVIQIAKSLIKLRITTKNS